MPQRRPDARAWRRAGACATALLLAACSDRAPDTKFSPALKAVKTDEVLLDVRADGAALYGRVTPPVVDGDPERILFLRTVLAGKPLAAELEGLEILDARFVGDEVAILDREHVLSVRTPGAAPRELDRSVEGPLSIAGDLVAYVRGEMPEFEVFRANVKTGVVEPITASMSPAWSPALSPDGREVIFASGADGDAKLYRRAADGTTTALPELGRIPSSPSAPRWTGDTLVFEDEAGLVHVDLAKADIVKEQKGARGLVELPDGVLAGERHGSVQPLGGAR